MDDQGKPTVNKAKYEEYCKQSQVKKREKKAQNKLIVKQKKKDKVKI